MTLEKRTVLLTYSAKRSGVFSAPGSTTTDVRRIAMAITVQSVLSNELLARFAERAPRYDQDNRFFDDDFADLRDGGYLVLNVPKELGGLGLSLPEVCHEQRRLAYYAHATVLAVNMHLYWIGVAADLWRAGDASLEWMLRGAVDGEVFAAGHAETGNDLPLLWSTTQAERVAGGDRFTGRKSFSSLTPVWTYLGIHGMDTSDPHAPQIVHALRMMHGIDDDLALNGGCIRSRIVCNNHGKMDREGLQEERRDQTL
jgi:alkylation response protein AidB-like acyl-CoA dehydrogenase